MVQGPFLSSPRPLPTTNDDSQGPKVNIEHHMLGREGNVIEGKEDNSSEGSGSLRRTDSDDKKISEVA